MSTVKGKIPEGNPQQGKKLRIKKKTMDTSYNKEKDEDEGMTIDSKPSTPDPTNPDQVIDSDV